MIQNTNQYFIHRQPTRTQVAEHYHSTLEEPNLENVESMLAATRQRNYQLGAQYFREKYGDSRQYKHMMESMGLEPPPDAYPKQRTIHDFRTSQEYGDYVRHNLEQKKHEIVQAVAQAALQGKSVKPTVTYNPWNDDSKKATRPQDKQAVEVQFLSKFEKFRENKQRRESPEAKPQPQAKPAPKRNYRQQLITKIYKEIDAAGRGYIDKMQLLEYLTANKKVVAIFNIDPETIAGQLYQHPTANEDAMTLQELLGYFGEQPLDVSSGQQRHQQVAHSQPNEQESQLMKNCCLLSPQQVKLFQELFAELDVHSDMLVNRKAYIHHLLNNIDVRKALLRPAMFEPLVKRTILLYRMLDKIEEDGDTGTEHQRKSKQYISFRQFMDYFERPVDSASANQQINRQDEVKLVKFIDSINERTKSNAIELPEEIITELQKIVRSVPPVSRTFFKTLAFIEKVKMSQNWNTLRDEIARRGGQADGLETESVEEVLERMLKEANEYIELPEMLMFFTRRGRPIEFYKERDEGKRKMEESIKGSKILAQEYNYLRRSENEEVQAYDSDPEVYNGSFVKRQQQEDGFRASRLKQSQIQKTKLGQPLVVSNIQETTPFKGVKQQAHNKSHEEKHGLTSNPQFKETFVSVVEEETRRPKQVRNSVKTKDLPRAHSASHQYKVTFPEPFKFDAREEQKKALKDQQQLTENTLSPKAQHTIKAKEIPKAVKEIGLYEKIAQENERRREETKRNSMMMTLANERPFSFQNRDNQKARKKTHQEREEFIFKAKPVPWYCSVELLKKQNEEDLIKRKEKVSRMAQQSLALSKLPPRMEKNEMEKRAEKLREGGDYIKTEEQVQKRKTKDPPDFQKLQKALEEELERKKLNKKPTVPVEFQFHSGKKSKSPDQKENKIIADIKNEEVKIDPLEAARKIMQFDWQHRQTQPKVRAPSTKKFDQQVEKRRKQMQERKQREKLRNKVQPPQFVPDIKPKLLTTECVLNGTNKLSEKQKEAKERKKQQEEAERKKFGEWKKGIIDRAKAQPLLVDRPLKRDEQMDRMKKLALISATLDQNGVTGKEKDALFSKEELNLLKDYEFLKKNGKL